MTKSPTATATEMVVTTARELTNLALTLAAASGRLKAEIEAAPNTADATLRRELAAMVRERDAAIGRAEKAEARIAAFTAAATIDGSPRAAIAGKIETFIQERDDAIHGEKISLRGRIVDQEREIARLQLIRAEMFDRLTRIERAVLRVDPRAEVGNRLEVYVEDMLSDRSAITARVIKTWLDEIDCGPEKAISIAKDDRAAHVKL